MTDLSRFWPKIVVFAPGNGNFDTRNGFLVAILPLTMSLKNKMFDQSRTNSMNFEKHAVDPFIYHFILSPITGKFVIS